MFSLDAGMVDGIPGLEMAGKHDCVEATIITIVLTWDLVDVGRRNSVQSGLRTFR